MLEDLSVFRRAAKPLARPDHCIKNLSQLARRSRLTDEQIRRPLARLETRFGTSLVLLTENRLLLSDTGQKLLGLSDQLEELESTVTTALETVTVEIDPALTSLLAHALEQFWEGWGDSVKLQFAPLNLALLRGNLAAGLTDFGLGFVDEDEPSGKETLETAFSWLLLSRKESFVAPTSEGLAKERLFLPRASLLREPTDTWLAAVPAQRRVECDSFATIQQLVEAGLGVGVVLNLGCHRSEELHYQVLPQLPAPQLGMYLPRNRTKLSEPAQTLLQLIRAVVPTLGLSGPQPSFQYMPTAVQDESALATAET